MNRVIINADDFGIHTEVNHAIIEACEQGVLTSTSLLPTGPAFEEAVSLARTCPRLGIGIHLCLVGSLPTVLSPQEVPTLVTDSGRVPDSYPEVIKRACQGRLDYGQVYRELDAQMEKSCYGLPTRSHRQPSASARPAADLEHRPVADDEVRYPPSTHSERSLFV